MVDGCVTSWLQSWDGDYQVARRGARGALKGAIGGAAGVSLHRLSIAALACLRPDEALHTPCCISTLASPSTPLATFSLSTCVSSSTPLVPARKWPMLSAGGLWGVAKGFLGVAFKVVATGALVAATAAVTAAALAAAGNDVVGPTVHTSR